MCVRAREWNIARACVRVCFGGTSHQLRWHIRSKSYSENPQAHIWYMRGIQPTHTRTHTHTHVHAHKQRVLWEEVRGRESTSSRQQQQQQKCSEWQLLTRGITSVPDQQSLLSRSLSVRHTDQAPVDTPDGERGVRNPPAADDQMLSVWCTVLFNNTREEEKDF